MRPLITRGLIAAAALISAGHTSSISAHNPLDHPDWCTENGRLVVVDEFEWDGDELAEIVEGATEADFCAAGNQDDSDSRTCGQFDDDWRFVDHTAASHCDRFSVGFVGATHPDHGTVIHIAEGPEAFNDQEAHHRRYGARMGLRGICVRCEPIESLEPAVSEH